MQQQQQQQPSSASLQTVAAPLRPGSVRAERVPLLVLPQQQQELPQQQQPMGEDEEEEQERDNRLVPLFWGLILLGWLGVLIFIGMLLSSDDTLAVHGLCGDLWEFMLIRTVCFGLEWAQAAAAFSGLENAARACAGVPTVERHQEGGCFDLLLGSNEAVRWFGTLVHFLFNAAFAVAGIIVVPRALADPAPCCVNALAAGSLTGTYTLGVLGWLYLISDGIQSGARGAWLAMRHKDLREFLDMP